MQRQFGQRQLGTGAALAAALVLGLGGCAETSRESAEVSELQGKVSSLERQLADKDRQLQTAQAKPAATPASTRPGDADVPSNAKSGECYARVLVPPQYRTTTEAVQVRAASEQIEVMPPVFKEVQKPVLIRAESQRLEAIPARYDWVEERVMVKPESERLITRPAVYENVSEQVMVRPAYTTWQRGRGPIERIDDATGEILCLVEVPAEYRTMSKQVIKQPAETFKEKVPAEYTTVRKQVMVEAPKTQTVTIPAEYRNQLVTELVESAKEKRVAIPAAYDQVAKTEKVADGRVEWRPVLCETNTSPGVIRRLQTALKDAGYDPGRIDGVLGSDTMAAVRSYQEAKRLPTGQLTIETMNSLGVAL